MGATAVPSQRPRFRGASHRIAFYVALAAGAVLVACAHEGRVATALYVATLAGMFGVSGTLHRADWGPRAFGWLRRADHAMIFAAIAGTYTPLCAIGVGGSAGAHLLTLAWIGSGLGIARAIAWPHAPRAVTALLYVAVGWVVIGYLPEVHAAMPPAAFALLVAGGCSFTVGAFVYLLRWPDPAPTTFGYHEVFHVIIIAGCACHFVAVALCVTR